MNLSLVALAFAIGAAVGGALMFCFLAWFIGFKMTGVNPTNNYGEYGKYI
jgi:hypothetical protein